jgi:hypothetical protein
MRFTARSTKQREAKRSKEKQREAKRSKEKQREAKRSKEKQRAVSLRRALFVGNRRLALTCETRNEDVAEQDFTPNCAARRRRPVTGYLDLGCFEVENVGSQFLSLRHRPETHRFEGAESSAAEELGELSSEAREAFAEMVDYGMGTRVPFIASNYRS